MGLNNMMFTHDYNKVLFYIFMLVITVSYILIFLNTLYMKLFLWKNRELNNRKGKLPDDTEITQIEPNGTIISMQDVFDYKLYLNSYESNYEYNENKCLKSKYNNDIVLTTNYNLYLNGLIFKTFFTYILLTIIIVFILYFSGQQININIRKYINDIRNTPKEEYKNDGMVIMISLLIIFPFIFLYSYAIIKLNNKYNLKFEDDPEDFENFLYGEIRELIIYENNNTEKKCFTDLKKFFENINKNNIENYVNPDNTELLSFAKNTFEKYNSNQRVYDICKNYIILCNKLSEINKYTNVDVVKHMKDFLYLCEVTYGINNSSGYEIDDTKISFDNVDGEEYTIEEIFSKIKDDYKVNIIIGISYDDLFLKFFNNNKKSIDNDEYDRLIEHVNKISPDNIIICDNDDKYKYVLGDIEASDKITNYSDKNVILNEIFNLNSKDITNKKILFFNSSKFITSLSLNEEKLTYLDFINKHKNNEKISNLSNIKLDDCYILSYESVNDNSSGYNDIDTVRCIFYNDLIFAFEKNLSFIWKIFTGNLIEDNDLKSSKNNDYKLNNIFFISMLTKNLFNMNYTTKAPTNNLYYHELRLRVKNYYYKKLNRNYNNFRDYITINGIVFGSFAIIVAYIILQIYYKQTNNKDLTYDINKYLLNTKINKGHDYIINLYASIALLIFTSNIIPSYYLFFAIFVFIILLFALPYPSNFIALFILYILPYLIIRYYISTSLITSLIIIIIFILTSTYLIEFLNYTQSENTISDIISKIITFTVFILIIIIFILIYFYIDIKEIFNNAGNATDIYTSSFYYSILIFVCVILPLTYFILTILFSINII